MNPLISLYIDDELELDEKITFVRQLRDDSETAEDALSLLEQEKALSAEIVSHVPALMVKPARNWSGLFQGVFFRSLGWAGTATAAILALWIYFHPMVQPQSEHRRFVVFRPGVTRIDITGTFTDWKRLPLKKIGDSGYWEISLDVPAGEHRYAYILDDGDQFSDPTVMTWETDDFGGQNTILNVEDRA